MRLISDQINNLSIRIVFWAKTDGLVLLCTLFIPMKKIWNSRNFLEKIRNLPKSLILNLFKFLEKLLYKNLRDRFRSWNHFHLTLLDYLNFDKNRRNCYFWVVSFRYVDYHEAYCVSYSRRDRNFELCYVVIHLFCREVSILPRIWNTISFF